MQLFIVRKNLTFFSVLIITATSCIKVLASSYTLLPSDDGYVLPNGNSSSGGYLLVGANGWDGIVKFGLSPVKGTVTQAVLSVNPYGLPLWGNPIDVYGYGTQIGNLDASDYHAGTYLGSWTLPDLGFGQDAYFDVTSLFSSLNASYAAFDLRSGGVDVLSSLGKNYGHPSELTITTIPEPSITALTGLGFLFLSVQRKIFAAR